MGQFYCKYTVIVFDINTTPTMGHCNIISQVVIKHLRVSVKLIYSPPMKTLLQVIE